MWQANGGSLGTKAGIVTRLTGLKEAFVPWVFELAQKLRLERGGWRALGDDENSTKERERDLRSVKKEKTLV